jgi:hypothetical protein
VPVVSSLNFPAPEYEVAESQIVTYGIIKQDPCPRYNIRDIPVVAKVAEAVLD